ncbi:MAG: M50 family metallopeptidase, partial [Saccharofermentanales bacterium]
LICIVTGATIGFLLGVYGQGEKAELFFEGAFATVLVFLIGVLFLVITIFLHTSIHEFGHFIIGKMGGFQLLSYRILFLTWNYENGDIKFSVRKNVSYDGLCAMIPPAKSPSQAFMLLFYAAGVIVNLLASVVCLAALIFNPLMNPGIRLFLVVFAVTGLFVVTLNSLPIIVKNTPTDGKIIWSVLLKNAFAQELMEFQKISLQLAAGVRPRELVMDSVLPVNLDSQSMMFLLHRYFKELDSDHLEGMVECCDLFEKNLDKIQHHMLTPFFYELCHTACVAGVHEKAVLQYDKAGQILQKDKDVNGMRVKAYYEYYAKNDIDAARAFATAGLAVVDKFPIKGQATMEKDLLEKLMAKIETVENGPAERNQEPLAR